MRVHDSYSAALALFSLRGLIQRVVPPLHPQQSCPLKGRQGGRGSERLELQEGRAALMELTGQRNRKRKAR